MEDDHEPVTTERPDADLTDDLTDTGQQAVYIGEWLEQCTITNCGPEAAQFLAERGRQIFRRFESKLDALNPAKDILAADKDNASPLLRQRP